MYVCYSPHIYSVTSMYTFKFWNVYMSPCLYGTICIYSMLALPTRTYHTQNMHMHIHIHTGVQATFLRTYICHTNIYTYIFHKYMHKYTNMHIHTHSHRGARYFSTHVYLLHTYMHVDINVYIYMRKLYIHAYIKHIYTKVSTHGSCVCASAM
jgi:hypothetical protein